MKENIYFKLWQDALMGIRKNNPTDYKWMALVFITMGNALNILSILIMLRLIIGTPVLFLSENKVKFTDIQPIDSLIKFFLEFMLIPLIFNAFYLRIGKCDLYSDRNKSLSSGRIFATYMITSIIGVIFSIGIAWLYLYIAVR